jgi:hypothetical protein
MFNSTVIGTDFVSFFTSFAAVVIFLVEFFLEELLGPVSLDILFSLTVNYNKNLFY